MSKALVLTVAAAVGIAAACSEPTAPVDRFELPEPDTSLDPERLTVGEYLATPCAFEKFGNGLAHLRDRDEWALVDVFFGRMSANDSLDGPTERDLDVVRAQNGKVLHVFNVPAVRARMLLSRIPDLVGPDREREGHWITVREVPDATRYDVVVDVGFQRPLSDADIALIEDLGGRVTQRSDFINALFGVLPDQSIPELRANSEVAWVDVSGIACLS